MTEHRAQIQSDHGLHLPHTITSVPIGAGGQPLVTNRPLLEETKVIGGYRSGATQRGGRGLEAHRHSWQTNRHRSLNRGEEDASSLRYRS